MKSSAYITLLYLLQTIFEHEKNAQHPYMLQPFYTLRSFIFIYTRLYTLQYSQQFQRSIHILLYYALKNL